ncbi:MAG: carbohydrate ABC transporter permease [Clostridia bacterium]|nr:carbohydrate ABC transporter permease [Clostridia bacterium]
MENTKKKGNEGAAAVHAIQSAGDRLFDTVNLAILIVLCAIVVYPLYYVVLASITDPAVVHTGKLLLYPEAPYFKGYAEALTYPQLLSGYANTIWYTFLNAIVALATTVPAAYALSRRDLVGRRAVMFLFTFTMFFNGGIIPMFLTIKNLKIYNTAWALVLPAAVSVYNLIVCRSFFESSLPQELLEAAQIDGCNDFRFFFTMAIPLSKTIIAVMLLYYATSMWNTFFNALMFLQDESRMPLQVVLRNLVLSNQLSMSASGAEFAEKQKLVDQLKYVIITVSAVPLMIVYPFVQKYFASGVMLGAVKG